jgi:transcriptional regulator with XRE-family HTH domain
VFSEWLVVPVLGGNGIRKKGETLTMAKDRAVSKEAASNTVLENWLQGVRPYEEVLKELEATKTDYDKDPEFVFRFIRAQIAQDVHRILEERGIKPAELARQMGVDRQWVNNILNESGNLTIKSVARVTCALGCAIGFRIAESGEHIAVLPFHKELAQVSGVEYTQDFQGLEEIRIPPPNIVADIQSETEGRANGELSAA